MQVQYLELALLSPNLFLASIRRNHSPLLYSLNFEHEGNPFRAVAGVVHVHRLQQHRGAGGGHGLGAGGVKFTKSFKEDH